MQAWVRQLHAAFDAHCWNDAGTMALAACKASCNLHWPVLRCIACSCGLLGHTKRPPTATACRGRLPLPTPLPYRTCTQSLAGRYYIGRAVVLPDKTVALYCTFMLTSPPEQLHQHPLSVLLIKQPAGGLEVPWFVGQQCRLSGCMACGLPVGTCQHSSIDTASGQD